MAKNPKTRNPQDATLRNVRASRNRDIVLTARVSALEKALASVMLDKSVNDARVELLLDEVSALKIQVGLQAKASAPDAQPFAGHQQALGYQHSTAAPQSVIVNRHQPKPASFRIKGR